MCILHPKNLRNFTKSAIVSFALFVQSRSLENNRALRPTFWNNVAGRTAAGRDYFLVTAIGQKAQTEI